MTKPSTQPETVTWTLDPEAEGPWVQAVLDAVSQRQAKAKPLQAQVDALLGPAQAHMDALLRRLAAARGVAVERIAGHVVRNEDGTLSVPLLPAPEEPPSDPPGITQAKEATQ